MDKDAAQMKESVYQAKLLLALRTHPALKNEAIIWKISDRYNGGIPDFCIIYKGRTTWWECKVLPRKLTKLQEFYLSKINGNVIVSAGDWKNNWIRGDARAWRLPELIEQIVRRCIDA